MTSSSSDVAKARMSIAQVALKCIEMIRADKERRRKEAADQDGSWAGDQKKKTG